MDVARSDRAAPRRHALVSPSLVLFLAMFASQAGVLVLSPILSDVADDFGVSIAEAGQLRIVAAPLAVLVALAAGRGLTRFSPRALLGVGSALLAVGSVASAAAPTFALLARGAGADVGGNRHAARRGCGSRRSLERAGAPHPRRRARVRGAADGVDRRHAA